MTPSNPPSNIPPPPGGPIPVMPTDPTPSLVYANPPRVPSPTLPPNASAGVTYYLDYDAPVAVGQGGTDFGEDAPTVMAFNRAYVRSLDPKKQALFVGQYGEAIVGSDGSKYPTVPLDPAVRYALAVSLAEAGELINQDCDAQPHDPFFSMQNFQRAGLAWVSPMFAPGQSGATLPVPPGMLLISTTITDFPPYIAAPPPPPVSTTMIGISAGAGKFDATQYAINQFYAGKLVVGQAIAGSPTAGGVIGTIYYFSAINFLGMGWQCLWTTTPPSAN